MIAVTEVRQALDGVARRIAVAAERAGRDPASIQVIAVTKGFPVDVARVALDAGLDHLGENRVQEATPKIEVIGVPGTGAKPTWHLLGHLQTNKAGIAAEHFDWVHTVDSLKLAQALDRRRQGDPLDVLLQVKTSTEPTKTGLAADDLLALAPDIAELPNLRVRGLMTIAPRDPDPDVARRAFRTVRELAERLRGASPGLRMDHLSMGMSADFEIAIAEGATMVRLGTGLFGPRP